MHVLCLYAHMCIILDHYIQPTKFLIIFYLCKNKPLRLEMINCPDYIYIVINIGMFVSEFSCRYKQCVHKVVVGF